MIEWMEGAAGSASKGSLAWMIESFSKGKIVFSAGILLVIGKVSNFLSDNATAIGAAVCILTLIMNWIYKHLERRDRLMQIRIQDKDS
jgi:hypothetical protein